MTRNATVLRVIAASLCLGWASARAQSLRPPQIQSPIVHTNRTVTFNFRAPNAKKVDWMNARHYLIETLQLYFK